MQSLPARVQRLRLVALFLIVAGGFACYRRAPFLVWNESPSVYLDGQRNPVASLLHSPREVLGEVLRNAFCTWGPPGFRPLERIIQPLASYYLLDRAAPTAYYLLFFGGLYGAFAVCFLLVARRFVRHERTAWFALALVLFSPPFTVTSWVNLPGPQVLVPLWMCLALLSYWAWTEQRRVAGLIGLGLTLLTGPWLREILFVTPLLIGFLEYRRARRMTWLQGVAAAAFVHAGFPTLLLRLTFWPELPLHSLVQFGGSVSTALSYTGIRVVAGRHFIPLFPPCLWAAALAAALVSGRPDEGPLRAYWTWIPAGVIAALAIAESDYFGLALSLLLPLLALRSGRLFLAVWFLLLFLPLLRVFSEHIHFLYALLPASIILAGTLEDLWAGLAAVPRVCWLRHAVAAVGILATADQALTVAGTACTMCATYDGIRE